MVAQALSINVIVTVSPVPNVVALPASQTICSGATTSVALKHYEWRSRRDL
ncbi:MAG: hypothetical protein U5K54_24945 [Cytophagales bacterium]|nr:hypothetical protein [Cytophagales bacterium]